MTVDKSLAVKALPPTHPTLAAVAARDAVATKTETSSPLDPGLDFDAVIDTINPLQHIPVISAIYREATGDTIGLAARAGGGFLFGGPVGLAAEVASAVFEAATGDTPLGHIQAAFKSDDRVKIAAAPVSAPRPFPWMG